MQTNSKPHDTSTVTEQADPLADFYLDLHHLNNTTTHDVEKLLTQFWQEYLNPSEKNQALKVLELSPPVDFTTIKKQYRRLAMKHHPDRGGQPDALVSINQAMQCLETYYSAG